MVILSSVLGCCCCCVTHPLRRWLRVLRQIVMACIRFYLWTIVLGELLYVMGLLVFGPINTHYEVQDAVRAWDLGIEDRLRTQLEIPNPTNLDNTITFGFGILSVMVTTLRGFLSIVSAAKTVTPTMQSQTYERANQFWISKVDDMVRSITSSIIWVTNYVINFAYGAVITTLPLPFRDEPIWTAVIRLGLFIILLLLLSKMPTSFKTCCASARFRRKRVDGDEEEEEEESSDGAPRGWKRRGRDRSAPPSSRTRGRSRDRRHKEERVEAT